MITTRLFDKHAKSRNLQQISRVICVFLIEMIHTRSTSAERHRMQKRRIKALDEAVVNRIAAGEIIVAPANALKELLENAIDAQATSVEVLVKDGGVKLLQITDNGTGVDREDLPLLCQRFTTSKLTHYEDLQAIETYGFRGEALASISHIAHIAVTTKTEGSACAWRATYSDGALVPARPTESADPRPVAGKKGTQITVEDFFYNVPSRLRALKSASDEFSKILDVIGRYAVHTEGVGLSCKKFGDAHYLLTTRPNLTIKERIRTVFGTSIANELIPIEMDGIEEYGVTKVFGQITNPNYNNKKSIQPVFFINNRLVSNDSMKKALTSAINHFLPKGHRPFIYMSLHINPNNLDVNVHPTKREVRFLHEDEIIDKICLKVTEEFHKIDQSRSFQTQSLLPSASKRGVEDEDYKNMQTFTQKKPKYDYNLVRTDASQSKITNYLPKTQADISSAQIELTQMTETQPPSPPSPTQTVTQQELSQVGARTSTRSENNNHTFKYVDKPRIEVNLQSILDLRQKVQDDASRKLTEVFAKLAYIGVVDEKRRLIAIQFDVKLMLVDYASTLSEFFYQLGITDFSNFGKIFLDGKDAELDIKALLSPLYEELDFNPEKPIEEIVEVLRSMTEMLEEYFAIEFEQIDDQLVLRSIPLLLKGYIPPLAKLPIFLYKLATNVNWGEEKECLDGILKQIALFYIPEPIENDSDLPDNDPRKLEYLEKVSKLNESLENVLMPAVKKKFLAPKHLHNDVVEIANLPGLYRVFERC